MSTETLRAVAVASNNGCVDPANAHGAADGVWTSNDGDTENWDCRWDLGDPSGPLTGTQTLTVLCRKSSTLGNGNPTVTVEVWEAGVLLTELASQALGDTTLVTPATVGGDFAASLVSDPSALQVRVVSAGPGGMPAGRRSVQVDAATFTAEVSDTLDEFEGGSDAAVVVEAEGAGAAFEVLAGGSDGTVVVTADGAGTKFEHPDGALLWEGVHASWEGEDVYWGVLPPTDQHEQGGSDAVVTVSAVGTGAASEQADGGSDGAVTVTATGAGDPFEVQTGGSDAAVLVDAAGGVVSAEQASGGSDGPVSVTTTGAGEAVELLTGGSDGAVTVTAVGGGTASERADGGSDAVVLVVATGGGEGDGTQQSSGGSDALVLVSATGGGAAFEEADGGSSALVLVGATGGGVAAQPEVSPPPGRAQLWSHRVVRGRVVRARSSAARVVRSDPPSPNPPRPAF